MGIKESLKSSYEAFSGLEQYREALAKGVNEGNQNLINTSKAALSQYASALTNGAIPDSYFVQQPLDTALSYFPVFSNQSLEGLLTGVKSDVSGFFKAVAANDKLNEQQRFSQMVSLAYGIKPTEGEGYSEIASEHKKAVEKQKKILNEEGKPDAKKYLELFNGMPLIKQAVEAQLSRDTSLIDSYLQSAQVEFARQFIKQNGNNVVYELDKLSDYLAAGFEQQEEGVQKGLTIQGSNLLFYEPPRRNEGEANEASEE
jgi:hypothetical protein